MRNLQKNILSAHLYTLCIVFLNYEHNSQYSDKRIDTLTRAKIQDCIIGNWIPTQQETNLDSFEINKITRDCIKRDTSNSLKRFRYTILTDSTVVFDYFEMYHKDTLKYFISSDRLLLMLKKKDYIVSLRRI